MVAVVIGRGMGGVVVVVGGGGGSGGVFAGGSHPTGRTRVIHGKKFLLITSHC